jgi:hypothetical protein
MNKTDVIEAALLAKMVGTELNKVDKSFMDRPNIPANKININQFISQSNLTSPSKRKISPAYLSEAEVQNLVPEPVSQLPNLITEPAPVQPLANINPIQQKVLVNNDYNIVEDIQEIKSVLIKINNNLQKISGMAGKLFCGLNNKTNG